MLLSTWEWKRILYFSLCVAVVFVLVALLQQEYLRRETDDWNKSRLDATIRDTHAALIPNGRWDFEGYRNTNLSVPVDSFILTGTSQLVDLPDKIETEILAATSSEYKSLTERPNPITSDAGETWCLGGKEVTGGFVIIGMTKANEPSPCHELSRLFASNLKKFGFTLNSAEKVGTKNLDYPVEGFLVLDRGGAVRQGFGGIPLRVAPNSFLEVPTDGKVHEVQVGKKTYLIRKAPDTSVTPAAVIYAYDDISSQRVAVESAWRYNLSIFGGALAAILVGSLVFFGANEFKIRKLEITLEDALRQGESQYVEFKSGLGEKTFAPAVAAFANSNSGNIFVGIEDSGVVIGIDAHTTVERDTIQKKLRNVITQNIDPPVLGIRPTFIDHHGKTVLRVFVQKGDAPIHLVDGVAYIRLLTSVTKADARSLVLIIKRGHTS